MKTKTYLTPKDEESLRELFMGGVPVSAAIVQIEQLISQKVQQSLREHGVYEKEDV